MLGDDKKRQQYDTFGTTSSDASGGPTSGFGGGGYQYQSQVDPEELFRTIFGDAFKKGSNFESMFDGFGASDSSQQQYNDITQVFE